MIKSGFLMTIGMCTLMCISLFSFGQQPAKNTFEAQWKEVGQLADEGKFQSAFNAVQQIKIKAEKEKRYADALMAVSLRAIYAMRFEEDAEVKNLLRIEEELKLIEQPLYKSLLHSVLAAYYQQYYGSNRWEINYRETAVADTMPIDQWDASLFYQKALGHYMAFMAYLPEVKQEKLADYAEMLDPGDTLMHFSYVLDVLVDRAMDFLKEQRMMDRQKEVVTQEYLLPLNDFLAFLQKKASLSEELQLFQLMLTMHRQDENKDALVYWDTYRLNHFYNRSSFEQADEAYLKAMDALVQNYKGTDEALIPLYYQAKHWYDWGEGASMDSPNRWYKKKALGMIADSELDILIKKAYDILGLITFFTTGPDETRAWTIKNGQKASQAAGVIHGDFESHFIKAEVIYWKDLLDAGGYAKARERGLVRTEGKDYIVKDGDVIEIKHNA